MADSIKHLQYKFSTISYDLIRECDDYELRFYAWLKLWAINKEKAWPGVRTIRDDLGWSFDKIIAAINKMEQKGRLVVTRTDGQNSVYDITWYDRVNENGRYRSESRSTPLRKSEHPNNRYDRSENRSVTNTKLKEITKEDEVEIKKPNPKVLDQLRKDLVKDGILHR